MTTETGRQGSLRILSYNIHHGEGLDRQLSLRRIANEISSSGADTVGLQEVDRNFGERSAFADQAAELAGLLGMTGVFSGNLVHPAAQPGGPQREYGNAILTRRPLHDYRSLALPMGGGGGGGEGGKEEPRGVQSALLRVNGMPVRMLNTHLEVADPETRRMQAAFLAELVAASAKPVVLTGDLNAAPDDPTLKPLLELMTDGHAEAGSGGGETFVIEPPAVRIDYVLTKGLPVTFCAVPKTTGSDHWPVMAHLAV